MATGSIAMRQEEYFPILCPTEFHRKKTAECKRDALGMLKAYHKNSMISDADYNDTKKEIEAAPHDDAISNIMTKVRKRARW